MNKIKLSTIRFKKSFWVYMGGAVVLIAGLIFSVIADKPDGKLHVNFYDVGQGDAILIETPKNHQILVDGGPDSKILSKLSNDLPFYDKSLDMVVITHPHADHIDGLVDVFQRYQVNEVLMTGVTYNTPDYTELFNIIKDKNILIKTAFSGQEISWGDGPKIKILEPEKSLRAQRIGNINNSSIVLKIEYENKAELLTGDFESSAQNKISYDYLTQFKANVLKVAHHGSRNGLSERFLKAVDPDYAIISVGAHNPYGHPAKDILDLLSKYTVFRTDIDGDVSTSIDNAGKLEVSSQK
jgi:competence protein ComEC